jgi:hypothetical protein
MTRKDYIILAEALRVQYHRGMLGANDADASLAKSGRCFVSGVYQAASEIADALQRDNSRFNREHFLAVVRGEKELHSRPSRNGGAS